MKCPVYSRQIKELQNVYLLSFNYTFTYQNVYGESKLKKYHSVHGNIKDNNLVLGISDDGCDDLDYIYFQKYFQRIQKRTGSDYRKWISEGEKRAELIEKKHNVSPKKAAKIVEDTDLRRRTYHNYYTGEEWGNAEYYDICIDVSKVGEDGALRLIEAYINETGVL